MAKWELILRTTDCRGHEVEKRVEWDEEPTLVQLRFCVDDLLDLVDEALTERWMNS